MQRMSRTVSIVFSDHSSHNIANFAASYFRRAEDDLPPGWVKKYNVYLRSGRVDTSPPRESPNALSSQQGSDNINSDHRVSSPGTNEDSNLKELIGTLKLGIRINIRRRLGRLDSRVYVKRNCR
jgi:hypothetical protein